MAAITGPKVQVPSALKPVFNENGVMNTDWQVFFHAAQQIAFNLSRSGPTTSRPTSALDGRWIGMQYFDTTLGFMIYLKSVTPDVWVNGAGAPV